MNFPRYEGQAPYQAPRQQRLHLEIGPRQGAEPGGGQVSMQGQPQAQMHLPQGVDHAASGQQQAQPGVSHMHASGAAVAASQTQALNTAFFSGHSVAGQNSPSYQVTDSGTTELVEQISNQKDHINELDNRLYHVECFLWQCVDAQSAPSQGPPR